MKCLLSLLMLFSFQFSFAQSTAFLPPVPSPQSETASQSKSEKQSSEVVKTEPQKETAPIPTTPDKFSSLTRRGLSQYTGNVHFSPLSTWVPFKYGLSLGYVYNSNWTFEGEWTQKTFGAGILGADFADVKDERYGIQARWYPGHFNSFHFIVGLFKSKFSSEFGSKIIGNMTNIENVKVWEIESYGPQLGFGNRWQVPYGVTLGVDWFVMYYPLFGKRSDDKALASVNNSSDRSDVDKVASYVSNIPQFDLFRMTLGYTF